MGAEILDKNIEEKRGGRIMCEKIFKPPLSTDELEILIVSGKVKVIIDKSLDGGDFFARLFRQLLDAQPEAKLHFNLSFLEGLAERGGRAVIRLKP